MTAPVSGAPFTVWVPAPRALERPRTKGSLTPQVRYGKDGRPLMRRTKAGRLAPMVRLTDTDSSQEWRGIVADALRKAWVGAPTLRRPMLVGGQIVIHVPFDDVTNRLAGDGDKHLRLVWDAVTDAGIWEDDAQGQGWAPWKITASEDRGPGLEISLWALPPLVRRRWWP